MPKEQNLAVPSTSVVVAPGARGTVINVASDRTRGYQVFLKRLGIAIDPVSNKAAATFRLLVNGSPFYPFNNITSQVGDLTNPTPFEPAVKLGEHCTVEVSGEMSSAAVGNTEMAGTIQLLLVPVEGL